jgi:hypothetical protein
MFSLREPSRRFLARHWVLEGAVLRPSTDTPKIMIYVWNNR